MIYRKKLIEVALPLDPINAESKRDKKLSSGHPTTLHYWWAPRPLAACRAVVFAALVDDPSAHPELFPDQAAQDAERERLLQFITELSRWESRKDPRILGEARREIAKSTGAKPPKLFDPFCGRGLIPLEGQRLGLDVVAADLNPVAAVIAKTLIEIVPKFLHQAAINPQSRQRQRLIVQQEGEGFIEDVEYYAKRILEIAQPSLESLFPIYEVTPDIARDRPDLKGLVGRKMTVMGWLWARTVQCSNPACRRKIPLVGSFWLSRKPSRRYWLEPVVDRTTNQISFHIRRGIGSAPPPTKLPGTGGSFKCPACKEDSDDAYVEQEGRAGRVGTQLMACIADGGRMYGRVYLPATEEHERIARSARPDWRPDMPIPDYSQAMPTARHGVTVWADLFTSRQLVTLDTLSGVISGIHQTVLTDAKSAGLADDDRSIEAGGLGARAYADGIVTFLALILGKQANRSCAFNFWDNGNEKIQQPFAQQGIQKTWDFVESNPFCESSGSWLTAVEYPVRVIRELYPDIKPGRVMQQSVANSRRLSGKMMVITDPPYYDNMGYADLSDFFYIWERRALQAVYPAMFSTLLTPKAEELAAVRHRFGGDRRKAEQFFVEGFDEAFRELATVQSEDYPMCVFYAYKQKETKGGDVEVSTGWETMLRGLVNAGLTITGTWPMLSESIDTIKKGKSSLSTSIVLVCRNRPPNAGSITKRQFLGQLKTELPDAIARLQHSNIAPVDLAQASIGPGMSVFSRYDAVLDAEGKAMVVREALALINQTLDEVLAEQEGDFDADTRWALAWFEHVGFGEGEFGVAETLSKAKNTSVAGMFEAGILTSRGGKVQLLRPDKLPADWDPATDKRLTTWEMVHQLVRVLEASGESAAAALMARLGSRAETARELAYRLYTVCERKKRAQEALSYNGLVQSWPEIARLARESGARQPMQGTLGF